MNIPGKCDVVIIGGGPAGSLAATYLAQAGYDAVLFDREKHPRFQVGENLIPDFWKYCDEAGVSEKIVAEGFIQKAGGTVAWGGDVKRMAFKDFGYTRPALHIERDRFDYILLENARDKGAQVYEEITVLATDLGADVACVTYRANGDTATNTITCRFVVDASGQNAVIGRQLGLRSFDPAFRFMSVWGYFKDSHYLAADGAMYPAARVREIPPTTYVTSLPESVTGSWGWSWHIILRESTSVGFIIPQDAMQRLRQQHASWESYFLAQCYELPTLGRLLSGASYVPDSWHIIRDYSYRSTRLAGPGYFLIGDAAGFIDPIFSVGLTLAMYSARVAAWTIDRIFRTPQRYEEQQAVFAQQLQARLELGRTLALPRYQSADGQESQRAKEIMQFASAQGQALMYAATLLTARAHNFDDLVTDEEVRRMSRARVHKV